MHQKINKLSENRMKFFLENKVEWYSGSEKYFDALKNELSEALEENKKNNHIYLEDELGDIFWVYMCLLNSLKLEGKITNVDAVLERAYNKFSERIGKDGQEAEKYWNTIKKNQKEEREDEHKIFYNK